MKKEELIKWIKESVLDKNGNVHRSKLLNTIFYQQNKQYYDILFDMFKSQNIKECVYLILNNLKEIPKCKCGNNLNFKGYSLKLVILLIALLNVIHYLQLKKEKKYG